MFEIKPSTALTISIVIIIDCAIGAPLRLCSENVENCAVCVDGVECGGCVDGYVLESGVCIDRRGWKVGGGQSRGRMLQGVGLGHEAIGSSSIGTLDNGISNRGTQVSNIFMYGDSLVRIFWFGGPGTHHNQICIYQYMGVCIICQQGYQIGPTGTCIPHFPKCLTYTYHSTLPSLPPSQHAHPIISCVKCHQKFALDTEGQCYDIGCEIKNYYRCRKCRSGYVMNLSYQFCEVEFCVGYRDGACIGCAEGLQVVEGVCVRVRGQERSSHLTRQPLSQPTLPQPSQIASPSVSIISQPQPNPLSLPAPPTSASTTSLPPTPPPPIPTPTPPPQTQTQTQTPTPKIPFCQTQTSNICQSCQQGYYSSPQGQSCRKISRFCSRFDHMTRSCVQCQYNQTVSLVNGVCVDSRCVRRRGDECLECGSGFKVNKDGVCESNRDGNQFCEQVSGNFCVKCKENYYLNSLAQCLKLPDNCLDQTCQFCNKGYTSLKNTCIPLLNCLKYQNNTCLTCQTGYSLTTIGSCTLSIPNCLKHAPSGCLACPPNYLLLSNSSCQFNPSFRDANCKYRNQMGECQVCRDRYRLEPKYGYVCMGGDVNCRTVGKDGMCGACYEGYRAVGGVCVSLGGILNCAVVKDGKCDKCAERYFLENGVCKQVSNLCNSYDENSGYCTSCYDGYFLLSNQCLLVSQLGNIMKQNSITSFSQLSNLVKSGPPQSRVQKYSRNPLCKTQNQVDGSCLSCYEGYVVQGVTCVVVQSLGGNGSSNLNVNNQINSTQYINFCRRVDQIKKQCIQCIDRYYLQKKSCKQVSPDCKTYNSSTGTCLSCYQGYTLTSKGCIQQQLPPPAPLTPPNCLTTNPTTLTCTKCLPNFYLFTLFGDATCLSIPAECADFDQELGECKACHGGYMRNGVGECVRIDPRCVRYGGDGGCQVCGGGSRLERGVCL